MRKNRLTGQMNKHRIILSLVVVGAIAMNSNLSLAQDVPSTSQQAQAPDSMVPADPKSVDNSNRLIRPKYTEELNKESSSFVAEPDPLDPQPLKNESLKEDEEPVLEDIKSILSSKNLPAKKKVVAKPKPAASVKKKKVIAKAKPKSKTKKLVKKNNQVKTGNLKADKNNESFSDSNRIDDEPNYVIEQKFHNYYEKYNAQPTSDEAWGHATSSAQGQNINIYTVQKGDTLATISRTLFGDAKFWPKIWSINRAGITNPHQIIPGAKIYIMSGNENSAPALTVGEESDLGKIKIASDLQKYDRQYTEFNSTKDLLDSLGDKVVPFQKIPASFPRVLSDEYMNHAKSDVEIMSFEHKPLPELNVVNPYVFSSVKVKSEISIKESEIEKLLCREGHYVPPAIKIEEGVSVAGDYLMLIREDEKFSQLSDTYVYRKNGSIKVNADGSLRVSKCIENSTSDLVFITDVGLNAAVQVPKETLSKIKPGQIVEGFAVYSQSYFTRDQYFVFLLPENIPSEGSKLNVYSDSAGRVVGKVQFLKKEGTLGLGYVLDADDAIQSGDKLIAQ